MRPDKDNRYKTKDLGEIGALICSKQRVLGTQLDGKEYWFIFEQTPLCEELATRYYYEGILVNAREYSDTLKMLKKKVKPTLPSY